METQADENVASTATPVEAVSTEENGSAPARQSRPDRGGDRKDKPKKEFEEILLEVRRVTRVNTG